MSYDRWHSKISKNALDKSISWEYGKTIPKSIVYFWRSKNYHHSLADCFRFSARNISIKGLPTFTAYILEPALHTITSSYCRAHECSSIQLNRFIFLFAFFPYLPSPSRRLRLIFRARSLSRDRVSHHCYVNGARYADRRNAFH